MTPQEYFGEWWKIIPREEFENITRTLGRMYEKVSCIPNKTEVFKAFKLTPYEECNVVILGQDPYPQKGIATGLAFGNCSEPLSPSLEVIKEACIDYTIPHYGLQFDNTLESWAKQGVLLLNSALTCELNKPSSHVMLWRPFISKLLHNLSINNPGIIYVLLGEQAQTFKPYIGKYEDIIVEKHPAYYARTNTKMSNIFININKLLYSKTCKSIEWFTQIN